jgi:hypothetical protein
MKQKQSERVQDYNARFQCAAQRLSAEFPEETLMNIFIASLNDQMCEEVPRAQTLQEAMHASVKGAMVRHRDKIINEGTLEVNLWVLCQARRQNFQTLH